MPFVGTKLVVNGVLRPDQPIQVRITRTAMAENRLDEDLVVTNATVELYEDGVFKEHLVFSEEGFWKWGLQC